MRAKALSRACYALQTWYDFSMTRQPYPSDVSDEEWAFVAPSLTFMTEDAPQRDHALRPLLSPPAGGERGGAIASSALRQAQRIARERPGA